MFEEREDRAGQTDTKTGQNGAENIFPSLVH